MPLDEEAEMIGDDATKPRVMFVEITGNEQKGTKASAVIRCPFHYEITPSCIVNYDRMSVMRCMWSG